MLVHRAAACLGHWTTVPVRARAALHVAAARDALLAIANTCGGRGGTVTLDAPPGHAIATLTLSSPAVANALSPAMMLQFADAVAALEAWALTSGRAVVLRGDGPHFCAGADLSDGKLLGVPGAGAAMSVVMTDATRRLASSALISVAAMSGAAIGGGAELATATDFRVMAEGARLQFVHVERGATPGWGGLSRLSALAGRRNALYLLASAARLPPEQAAQFNLCDAIVTPTQEAGMLEHARAFLAPMLRDAGGGGGGGVGDGAIKRALAADDVAAAEAGAFAALWGGPDQVAAMQAWRRKPK